MRILEGEEGICLDVCLFFEIFPPFFFSFPARSWVYDYFLEVETLTF